MTPQVFSHTAVVTGGPLLSHDTPGVIVTLAGSLTLLCLSFPLCKMGTVLVLYIVVVSIRRGDM